MPTIDINALGMERIKLLSRILKSLFFNPMLNYVVPTGFMKSFLKTAKSPLLKECLIRPGSWMSMELSYDKAQRSKDWLDHLVLHWGAMPMALRNRKKLVARLLADLIAEYAAKGHVKILGIGAGPSRNLLSAVVLSGEKNFSATCIDLDADAFPFGKKIWKESGIAEDSIVFLQGDASDLTRKIHLVPQIVKLVGILEYLGEDAVERLLGVSFECMAPGGSLVTHSITPAHGVDPFMRRIFHLHLHYRSTDQMIALIRKAGFTDIQTFPEPIGVYTILTARKPA